MERLLLELDRLSSSMNRQLDECHGRLQDAIKDADQRVFALRTLVKAVQERPEGASGAASATHPAMARTQVANLYNVESQPGSHTPPSRSASSDDAASAGGAGSKLGAASVAKASSMEPVDPRTRRIYELADQGLTAREIARRLEDHVGEVELILHLRELARLPGS
jgi:DNA-binding NarL/FixJ family response regulator